MKNAFSLLTLIGVAASAANFAATIDVYPGDPSWVSAGNSGGGSSAITGTAPRSGTGSVEITGDRTRFGTSGGFGSLDDVLNFVFDWQVAVGSTSSLHADYTPALRLHIQDGAQFSELIWEGAYNGVYGTMTKGTWYTSGSDDVFHRWVTGVGATFNSGSQVNLTVADWAASNYYTDAAQVLGISVGAGSSVGGGYHAFADNVVLNMAGTETIYNFEVAVPEAANSLMLIGCGVFALAAFQARQRNVALATK